MSSDILTVIALEVSMEVNFGMLSHSSGLY